MPTSQAPSPSSDDGTLSWVVEDPDGSVVETGSQPIDSYVLQYMDHMQALFLNEDVTGVTQTDGTDEQLDSPDTSGEFMDVDAAAGSAGHGIVIGDDGTAETITDNNLGNQLTTDVDYESVSVANTTVSGGSAFLRVSRQFTNNGTTDKTIKEVGIKCLTQTTTAGDVSFLLLRDTGSPITTISPSESVTIQYELEVTV